MPRRSPSTPPVLPGLSYLRPLGSGGFADVFLYEQDLPRRTVAVKVILADAIEPEVRRRFAREVDLMARLSAHPSILSIHLASIAADGRPYLVTEFCPESLAAEARRGPLPVPRMLDTGVRIAGALETAHRAGVLHRDIKPSNLLVTALGAPVLADFGIAGLLDAVPGADADEVVAMSIPWSSPEVLDERTLGTVATEVWSLGATLWTLLAGRSPFSDPEDDRRDRDRMIARIRQARLGAIPRDDVPEAVESVLRRTMARDPSQRQSSMLELAEQLRWAQVQLGLPTTPVEVGGETWGAVTVAESADRGPVLPTVRADSRRAVRAAAAVRSAFVGRPSGAAAGRSSAAPGRRAVLAIAAVAALVVLAVAATVLAVIVGGGR